MRDCGNQKWAPRPVPINSWNFRTSARSTILCVASLTITVGPALTMFRTISGTPLYFNFHVTP
ncbi:hypothetical protein BANRA_05456 [Klebsiella pneumoniae]|nr:hypothetical protein BANRA_05456 [Klebsiella pneumoniae]